MIVYRVLLQSQVYVRKLLSVEITFDAYVSYSDLNIVNAFFQLILLD